MVSTLRDSRPTSTWLFGARVSLVKLMASRDFLILHHALTIKEIGAHLVWLSVSTWTLQMSVSSALSLMRASSLIGYTRAGLGGIVDLRRVVDSEGNVVYDLLNWQILSLVNVTIIESDKLGLYNFDFSLSTLLWSLHVKFIPFSVLIVGLSFFLNESLEFKLSILRSLNYVTLLLIFSLIILTLLSNTILYLL